MGGRMGSIYHRFGRRFGDRARGVLFRRVRGATGKIPEYRVVEQRCQHLKLLGLGGLSRLRNVERERIAAAVFRRLCRSALRCGRLDVSDERIRSLVVSALRNTELFLVLSAVDHTEALWKLVAFAADSFGQELGQELVLHLFFRGQLVGFDGSGSLSGWLYSCRRRLEAGPRSPAIPEQASLLPSGEEEPWAVVAKTERTTLIRRLLATLAPVDLRLVIRRYYCQWSHRAIARAEGFPHHSSSIRRLAGILQRMQRRLERRENQVIAEEKSMADLVETSGCRGTCPRGECLICGSTAQRR